LTDDSGMDSPGVIIIAPNSARTIEEDVEKLFPLLQNIVKVAEERLHAEFTIDVVDSTREDLGLECAHAFIIEGDVAKCIHCETEYMYEWDKKMLDRRLKLHEEEANLKRNETLLSISSYQKSKPNVTQTHLPKNKRG